MSQRRLGGRTHAEGLRRYARQQLPVVDTSLLAFAVDLCPKMATSPGFRVSAPEPVRTKKEMFLVVKIRVWHNSVDELRCGRGSAIAKKRYTVSSTSSLSVDRHFASDFRGYSTSHRAADRGIYGLSPVSRSSRTPSRNRFPIACGWPDHRNDCRRGQSRNHFLPGEHRTHRMALQTKLMGDDRGVGFLTEKGRDHDY